MVSLTGGKATAKVLEWNDELERGINVQVLLAALKECSRSRNLERGKQVHAKAVNFGHDCHIWVVSALINMYSKCGSMVDARAVFEGMKRPDVVSWTTLILGYADNGEGRVALDLFTRMRCKGATPDSVTFVAVLKACSCLAVKEGLWAECRERGKEIENFAMENGCSSDGFVQCTLIDMYAKCSSMVDAWEVFDGMTQQPVVSWNVLIMGYANNGQGRTALDLFTRMRSKGLPPDSVTFVAAFKACISLAANGWADCGARGKEVENLALENDCNSDAYVQNTLLDMHVKCGSMVDARRVFDCMKVPTVISWNVLIMGHVGNGQGYIALGLFTKMRSKGVVPDSISCVAALKACISLAVKGGASQWAECKSKGNEIQNFAVEIGCNSDTYLQNTLIDVFVKCNSMVSAREVFDGMKYMDVASWNTMILGYADSGQGRTALNLFRRLRIDGPALNSVTVLAALKACSSLAVKGVSEWGKGRDMCKEIHDIALENGCNSTAYVQNSLIDTYAKCGSMTDAREVFDGIQHPDVVSWTALILGYADNGQGHTALELFSRMKTEGSVPNSVTFVAALKACISLAVKGGVSRWTEARERGKEIHNLAVESDCNSDTYVQNTLVDMYAKCGSLVDACEVFDGMKHPDVVAWNVLILGYTDNGQGHTALAIFSRMKNEGHAPNSATFGAALKACGLVGALDVGRKIHLEIDSGNNLDVVLVTCLVDFYAKCGDLVEARSVFDSHTESRDVTTWTALLAGFSSCGDNEVVFGLFEEMKRTLKPDSVTFLCILTCCSHVGLVEKGKECFDAMSSKYGITPTIDHYNCMVDIFGRANKLNEAMDLLLYMPCSPNVVTWMTILGACRKWKNVELGRLAFQSLIHLKHGDEAAYVFMWE